MLKEQLKAAVVDVVKESFQKTSPFISKAELQTFINEVYVFLIDNMHIAFNKIIKIGSNKDVLEIDPDKLKTKEFNSLKEFADSCEVDRKFNQAALYHQERIARWEDSYQAWFDYGCFCMRCGMTIRGEECFKEILSKNDKHIPSLIAYSAICCIEEKYEESQLYIECACKLQPKNVIAHTVAGLFFDHINEEEESEKYLKKAYDIFNSTQAYKKLNKSFFVLTAEFLIKCHAGQLAERALTEEILNNSNYVYPYILLSQLEIQRGNYSNALERIKEALEIQQDNSSAWSALGNLQFIQENYEDSQISYETVVSLPREPADIDLVFSRLGYIYLNNVNKLLKSFDYQSPENHSRQMATIKHLEKQAKAMYIHASEIKPSSQTWLGVGKACYLLKEYSEAEDAFSEANVLNNRDGDVWAHIALLCLTLNRLFEANQAISQALRFGLKDPEILKQVGMEFMKKREPFPSIECFRIYLSHSPDDNEAKFYFSKCLEYEENPDWYMENYELEKLKEAEEANNEGKQDVVTRDVNLDDKLSFDDSNSKNNVNSDYHSNVSDDHLESVKSFESYNALKNNNNSSSISNDNRKNSDNYNNKSTSNNRIDELNSVTNANNYNMMSETFDDNVLND
jgi:tetratricopeptide (TPR) repeat protein